MKRPLKHVFDYILLCLMLSVFIALLIFYHGSPNLQKLLVVLSGSLYILWGYFHHLKEKTLDKSIIIEYFLYGVLGSVLIIGLL